MEQNAIPPEIAFRTICLKNGLQVSDQQLASLASYASLLREWNQKVNLVSRKDEENIWQGHLLHSVSPLFKVELGAGNRVLDLGTGGGLPGIPWSIMNPEGSFLLLDATQKKVAAVQNMIERLGAANARTVWGRAEDLGKRMDLAHAFDVVIARAVAPLADLLRWSRPFLAKGEGPHHRQQTVRRPVRRGTLLALKGGNIADEVGEIRRRTDVHSLEIIDLVFHGSETLPLVDKKLVIIEI